MQFISLWRIADVYLNPYYIGWFQPKLDMFCPNDFSGSQPIVNRENQCIIYFSHHMLNNWFQQQGSSLQFLRFYWWSQSAQKIRLVKKTTTKKFQKELSGSGCLLGHYSLFIYYIYMPSISPIGQFFLSVCGCALLDSLDFESRDFNAQENRSIW